ncbi:MAG: superoxide dismutase [Bacteroidales bacterium]
MDKRTFLKKGLAGMAGLLSYPLIAKAGYEEAAAANVNNLLQEGRFELPPLPYAYDALVPYIDSLTMQIHYNRHHAGYVNNLNNAIKDSDDGKDLESILKSVSSYSTAIRNNGGGHFNHSLFWEIMSPKGGGQPTDDLLSAINSSFGSFESFKEKFSNAAATRFGSGWAWLIVRDGKLMVTSTPNQDNPLMDVVPAGEKGTPILGLDVWEHAYYLNYQNKRGDYISAFWNIINWGAVGKRFREA